MGDMGAMLAPPHRPKPSVEAVMEHGGVGRGKGGLGSETLQSGGGALVANPRRRAGNRGSLGLGSLPATPSQFPPTRRAARRRRQIER